MRRISLGLVALAACAAIAAYGQTHTVKKTDSVVRAVAVYEWTGEEGKPTASRVVPVSLFIDGQFQDAAIYMARPVPFALDTGTVYEVGKAGAQAGTLELIYEQHLTDGDAAEIDDGWLGYGRFTAKPKETLVARRQTAARLSVNGKDADASGSPKLGTRTAAQSTVPVEPAEDDPSAPTLHRRAGSGGDATAAGSETPPPGASADGPGQSADSVAKPSPHGTDQASADSSADAERPTLKHRSSSEIKATQKAKDSARVVAGNDLNDDPDRPSLHRGSKAEGLEQQVPPLRGLPEDMKQAVAVSDAKARSEHDFARGWESEEERVQVLGTMEGFARQQLAAYRDTGASVAAAAKPAAVAKSAQGGKSAAARRAGAVAQPASGASTPLQEESLKGYTLSYGGAATYVYAATASGANGGTRYLCVVAQDVPTTGLKVALASVTDSSHLDRTPWMRLVDVVDADASNRASLVMELRAQHTRQFALYRVIGAQADQVFLSGSTE